MNASVEFRPINERHSTLDADYPLGRVSAKLMREAGYAVDVISKLILEDICRKDADDQQDYLGDHELGGLLAALTVVGGSLQAMGERCEVSLDKAKQRDDGGSGPEPR